MCEVTRWTRWVGLQNFRAANLSNLYFNWLVQKKEINVSITLEVPEGYFHDMFDTIHRAKCLKCHFNTLLSYVDTSYTSDSLERTLRICGISSIFPHPKIWGLGYSDAIRHICILQFSMQAFKCLKCLVVFCWIFFHYSFYFPHSFVPYFFFNY